MNGRTKGLLFLEALLGYVLPSVFMLYGMKLTKAVSAGIILALIPAVVAGLSAVSLRERISRQTAWGIALAVQGIGLYAVSKQEQTVQLNQMVDANNIHNVRGDLLIFAPWCARLLMPSLARG